MRFTGIMTVALLVGAGAAWAQSADSDIKLVTREEVAASKLQYRSLKARLDNVLQAREQLALDARDIADELEDLQARIWGGPDGKWRCTGFRS